jgi:hypothetical protein
VREAEEIETARALATLLARWPPERKDPRFLWVKIQAESLESLRENSPDPLSVTLRREDDHEIVGIPNKRGSTLKPRLDLELEPLVQHLVEIDVREEGANDPSLRGSGCRRLHDAVLQHPSFQPLVHGSTQHAVPHPLVQETP